jgi:hypothetical protein
MTSGVTVKSFWSPGHLTGLRYLPADIHNGVESIGVSGYQGPGSKRHLITIWIAASAAPLPSEMAVSTNSKDGAISQDGLVTNWVKATPVARPAHSISYSALTAGTR